MRISDWSSDVCSSDLLPLYGFDPADLTFDRTRRPPGQNGAFHGIDVAGDVGRKAAKFTVHCLFEPFVELGHFVDVEQRDEPQDRKSVVSGKRGYARVDRGGSSLIQKNKKLQPI